MVFPKFGLSTNSDDDEILAEVVVVRRTSMALPLAQTLVVDLTHVVAGPFATKTLRDLGARVIKVESRKGSRGGATGPGFAGDITRQFPPKLDDGKSGVQSAYFAMLNSGKESIALQVQDADCAACAMP